MVNAAQLRGNTEFVYEFKTSLRCRDPDGDFIYLYVIPAGKKKNPSLEINLEINSHKQRKCLACTRGDSLGAQKFADFEMDALQKNFI